MKLFFISSIKFKFLSVYESLNNNGEILILKLFKQEKIRTLD